MTAQNYIALTSDDLGANKIFRAATASALDSNPVAIAQRGTDAPWLNGVGAMVVYTSGSGNFTVPAGVYRIKVIAIGGGGGSGVTGSAGGTGGNTTFSTLTANGGAGGVGGGSPSAGAGGTATGGDYNLSGESGVTDATFPARSALHAKYGRGGYPTNTSSEAGGGAGGTAIKIFTVAPGDVLAYSVGAAGTAGGKAGTAGAIFIEY